MPPSSGFTEDWKNHVDDNLKSLRESQHNTNNILNQMALQHVEERSELKIELQKIQVGTSLKTIIIQTIATVVPASIAAYFAYLNYLRH